MNVLRWFLSRTVRQATSTRRHIHKLLCAQRDILSPQAVAAITEANADLARALKEAAPLDVLGQQMNRAAAVADKNLKAYPHPRWRENVEVILVAMAVAMGIRTFFLQPFKIPTGSMQPTLYGITHENLVGRPDQKIPNRLVRFYRFWIHGISYEHVVAKRPGLMERFQPMPTRFLLFNLKQQFTVGGVNYTVWFPTDRLLERAGLVDAGMRPAQKYFQAGEDIIRLVSRSGDHLFVDRLTYNFRRPRRGEIIVFETRGVNHPNVPLDQFYIKRLVGLENERFSIGKDHHVRINGRRLDASTPHFENIYTFEPDAGENQYFGHVPAGVVSTEDAEYQIRPGHYMVLGDNTRNSLDSRFFGDFSREYVIGKAWAVYWPISPRFGWGYR